jgi:hypothetical protein
MLGRAGQLPSCFTAPIDRHGATLLMMQGMKRAQKIVARGGEGVVDSSCPFALQQVMRLYEGVKWHVLVGIYDF